MPIHDSVTNVCSHRSRPSDRRSLRRVPRTVAPQEALPRIVPPMLLRPGLPPAHSADWALEVKRDGMRAQLRVERDGGSCLRSRPGRDRSEQFPELEHLVSDLAGRDVLLDGELVCLKAAAAHIA